MQALTLVGLVLAWIPLTIAAKIKWRMSGRTVVPTGTIGAHPEVLAQANETSVACFLERLVTNRRRKIAGFCWVILAEDDTWIYYGRPQSYLGSGGWSSSDIFGVEVLDKVDRATLSRRCPAYEVFDGRSLTSRLPTLCHTLWPGRDEWFFDHSGLRLRLGEDRVWISMPLNRRTARSRRLEDGSTVSMYAYHPTDDVVELCFDSSSGEPVSGDIRSKVESDRR